MMINKPDWHSFKLCELFSLESAKGVNSQKLIDGNDVPYFSASKENNGFARLVSTKGFESWISKGNCLQFVNIGDAAAGHTNYVPCDFIAMNGKTTCGYNDNLNEYTGLFIATVLNKYNSGKFSFKEPWTGNVLKNTPVILPAVFNNGKYEPDWLYMENLIKNMISVCGDSLTKISQNKIEKTKINIEKWKNFRVKDLFDIHPTKATKLTNAKLFDAGNNPVVVNSAFNNGIGGYSSVPTTEKGNIITFSDTVDANTIFYQPNDFVGYSHVQGVFPTGCYKDKWNENSLLFFASVFRGAALRKHFDYVNKFRRDTALELIVYLPVDEFGEPDWNFMNNYIDSIKQASLKFLQEIEQI